MISLMIRTAVHSSAANQVAEQCSDPLRVAHESYSRTPSISNTSAALFPILHTHTLQPRLQGA